MCLFVLIRSSTSEALSSFMTYSSHNPNILSLDLNTSKSENNNHASYAHINAQLNITWVISISLFFSITPLWGSQTWLDRTSSDLTWTWSLNDLLDPHKIYENLL